MRDLSAIFNDCGLFQRTRRYDLDNHPALNGPIAQGRTALGFPPRDQRSMPRKKTAVVLSLGTVLIAVLLVSLWFTRRQVRAIASNVLQSVAGAPTTILDSSFEEPQPKNRFGHVFKHWGGWIYEGDCEFRVS